MFKNLIFYRFTKSAEAATKNLAEMLGQHRFAPCGAQELSRYGWTAPAGKLSDHLVHFDNVALLICAQKEEKILPAAVIRDALNNAVELIENEGERKVRKKERDEIKDEIIIDLLPKAFSRYSQTMAYIDLELGLLIVDSSSAKRAEELCSHLRQSLGSLPVTIPAMNSAPASIMTSWLSDSLIIPAGFEMGDEAELKDPSENGAVLRCKHEDLLGDEIRKHTEAGKQAVKLAVSWRESISMVISDDLIARKLKFSDTLLDQAADMGAEDAKAAFNADFFLMAGTIRKLIPELLAGLGGENHEAYDPSGFDLK